MTRTPSFVWTGLSPTSTGNSVPSLRTARRSSGAFIGLGRVSQQFTPSIAKRFLGLGVHELDQSMAVYDDDGDRCKFQQRPEFLLAVSQRFFHPLALRDVFLDGQEMSDDAVGVGDWRNGCRLPIQFAVF